MLQSWDGLVVGWAKVAVGRDGKPHPVLTSRTTAPSTTGRHQRALMRQHGTAPPCPDTVCRLRIFALTDICTTERRGGDNESRMWTERFAARAHGGDDAQRTWDQGVADEMARADRLLADDR